MSAVRRLAASPRFLLTPLAAIALGGCASVEESAMQRVLASWKSAPIEEAKAQWGPPQAVQAVPGGTAYLWTEEVPPARAPGSGPRDVRAPTSPEPLQTPGQCQRRLIAGTNGMVIGGDWSGNACCLTTMVGRCGALVRNSTGS
ncbi:hypothetical protein UB46_00160 [Burkholderiaceae bacterium 16]|nr:hypothetical protein UB46_00160 [Burkholderiaceae bacterium 16]